MRRIVATGYAICLGAFHRVPGGHRTTNCRATTGCCLIFVHPAIQASKQREHSRPKVTTCMASNGVTNTSQPKSLARAPLVAARS